MPVQGGAGVSGPFPPWPTSFAFSVVLFIPGPLPFPSVHAFSVSFHECCFRILLMSLVHQ